MANNEESYTKGMAIGLLLGGAIGAVAALLLAPKSGKELRQDLAEKSGDIYNDVYSRASEYGRETRDKTRVYINEGKARAQDVVKSARDQAEHLLFEAEELVNQAKDRVSHMQSEIKDNIADLGKREEEAEEGSNA